MDLLMRITVIQYPFIMKNSALILLSLLPLVSMQAQDPAIADGTIIASSEAIAAGDPLPEGVAAHDSATGDGLTIWPVPAAEVLHISCAGCGDGNLPFEIVDLTGRTVLRGSVPGTITSMIELTGSKGDHVLRVVDGRSVRSVAFVAE